MGKTYIDAVKYMIYAHIEIDGIVEKPDVIGAIFGQTEGLLGDELDLRELQKSGRIGRIEVELKKVRNKSVGTILVPSALDRVETAVIAAALETIDRVGPCSAKVRVDRVEDTRSMKRSYVVERAKEILKEMVRKTLPDSKEILEKVSEEAKMADIVEYGPEKIPAGPDIDEADHIILVEGRADVLNLLRYDIKNVIAVGGKKVPKSLIELTKKKTVTAFIDGDRGGDLVLRQLIESGAKIDFVARAPDGKEVEELTQKEILKCLRKRVPFEQYKEKLGYGFEWEDLMDELKGSFKGILLDESGNIIAEVDVKDIVDAIKEHAPYAVVFDGIVTQRIVDAAERAGTQVIVGVKKLKINPKRVQVIIA